MAVIVALFGSVDAHPNLKGGDFAVVAASSDSDGARFGIFQIAEIEGLATAQAQALRVLAVRELAGQHTHADEVGAVNAFEALGDNCFDTQQHRAFGGPVAR